LRVDLFENRVDDAARAAPGSPEVDENRSVGLEHVSFEGGVGYVRQFASHWVSLSRNRGSSLNTSESIAARSTPASDFPTPSRPKRSRGTSRIASRTIELSIFESPTRRSRKTIGTSTTVKPWRSAR